MPMPEGSTPSMERRRFRLLGEEVEEVSWAPPPPVEGNLLPILGLPWFDRRPILSMKAVWRGEPTGDWHRPMSLLIKP